MSPGKRVLVVGDSVQRLLYYALIREGGEATPMAHNTSVEKHTDLSWPIAQSGPEQMRFLWAPEVSDLDSRVRE
ncbi:unnamed protein product, partial [Discosporangium mesarthrocarpum]